MLSLSPLYIVCLSVSESFRQSPNCAHHLLPSSSSLDFHIVSVQSGNGGQWRNSFQSLFRASKMGQGFGWHSGSHCKEILARLSCRYIVAMDSFAKMWKSQMSRREKNVTTAIFCPIDVSTFLSAYVKRPQAVSVCQKSSKWQLTDKLKITFKLRSTCPKRNLIVYPGTTNWLPLTPSCVTSRA